MNIFDVMSLVCSKIRDVAFNKAVFFSNNIPNFLTIMASKASNADTSILINKDRSISIELCYTAYTNDRKTPIYIGISGDISKAIVDTFATMINTTNESSIPSSSYEMAIGILLPKKFFGEETSLEEMVILLREMYLDLLNCDPNMRYEADFALLRFHSSKEINIPMYDIEMMILGICFIYLSLVSMFIPVDDDSVIDTSIITSGISKEDLPEETLIRLDRVISDCCIGDDPLNTLRKSILSGQLLKSCFIE